MFVISVVISPAESHPHHSPLHSARGLQLTSSSRGLDWTGLAAPPGTLSSGLTRTRPARKAGWLQLCSAQTKNRRQLRTLGHSGTQALRENRPSFSQHPATSVGWEPSAHPVKHPSAGSSEWSCSVWLGLGLGVFSVSPGGWLDGGINITRSQ